MNKLKKSVSRPLIAHVIHRLQVGGLENGLVNLVNNLPRQKYRHVIICLTESSDFEKRIKNKDVQVYALHKKAGKDLLVYYRLWKLFRKIKPDISHSRNIATLEVPLIAALAGVPVRIHGEHGRDIFDLHGDNIKYQYLRKCISPFTHTFMAMSIDLADWLKCTVGISRKKISQIYNGVNIELFHPAGSDKNKRKSMPPGFALTSSIVIGTVGRLEPVKDQITLVKAFIKLCDNNPDYREQLRLVLLGDGSLRSVIEKLIADNELQDCVWLPGACNAVSDILREFDIFVLPSLGEGISNTILEAMSCGLPIVATSVGGNIELVENGHTGILVHAGDPEEMALVLGEYVRDKTKRLVHGEQGRSRVELMFSMNAMLNNYQDIYDKFIERNML